MTIKTASEALWNAVQAKITDNLSDQPGVTFQDNPVSPPGDAVVVVSWDLELGDEAVKLLVGELTVVFGCVSFSGDGKEGRTASSDLAYWLADLFLSAPHLGDVALDMLPPIISRFVPPPDEVAHSSIEEHQHWTTVRLVWRYTLARP